MNLNITVDLSSVELEKIIREAVERACPGYKAGAIDFSITQNWDWRGEACGHYLNKASVKMSPAKGAQ